MAALSRNLWGRVGVGQNRSASGSRTNVGLNAAYVHVTSGPAVAVRYMCQTADTIDELYIFLDTIGGTRGNISMECTIYNESTQTRPSTTARDVSTACAIPAGDDQWVKFTFGTPYTPAVGEILWLVCYNTAGAPATDFPNIMTATTTFPSGPVAAGGIGVASGYSVTAGFSANGTAQLEMPFVIKQGSNYFGSPFTQNAATFYTNNQLKRGISFTLPVPMVFMGVEISTGAAAYDKFQIFDSSTGPGGSALHEYDLDSDTNEVTGEVCGGKVFNAAITLAAGSYKAVVTYASNSQSPNVLQIEDYASFSAMFDALVDQDMFQNCPSVIDDGAGGWTTDKSVSPGILLLLDSIPAVAGGGAVRSPVGMTGGLS